MAYLQRERRGLWALALLLLMAGFARADEIQVTTVADFGPGSLRQALVTANSNIDDSLITFALPGEAPYIIDLVGPLPDLTTNISLSAPAPGQVTVQRSSEAGTPEFRIFAITGSTTVSLSGLTIANGRATGGSLPYGGGVLAAIGTHVTLTDCIFNNNGAGQGGALVSAQDTTLTRCTFSDNTAAQAGGAIIATAGTLSLTDCTLSNNATTGAAGAGGAISGNAGAAMELRSCTLANNTVPGAGGGIFGAGTVSLANCTVTGNSAANGGGLMVPEGSQVELRYVTVASNTATDGGGLHIRGTSTITHTIIAANTAPTAPDINGDITSEGFNLIGNNTNVHGLVASDFAGLAPLLGPLQNNGGPTLTMALQPGSPALDTPDIAALEVVDQRGTARPQGAGPDIGAFESTDPPPAPTVSGFTPGTGLTGDVVEIAGTGFSGATAVKFNGVTAPFSVSTALHLTALVPSGASTGKISVTTAAGDATSAADFVVLQPGSFQFSAATYSGSEDSTTATITVTRSGGAHGAVTVNYAASDGTAQQPGDYAAASGTLAWGDGDAQSKSFVVNIVNDGLHENAETVNLTLSMPTGSTTIGAQRTATLNIADNDTLPTLSGLSPGSGPVGTSVTINGANLGDAAVSFGGVGAAVIGNTTTSVTAVVPQGLATGSVAVAVSTAAGTASGLSFNVTVPPPALPTLKSLNPPRGPAGTAVTISGMNLGNATAVKFGALNAPINFNSGSQISTFVPQGAASGVVNVTVTTGVGVSNALSFNVQAPPGISAFSPIEGPPGTVVAISGNNFTGATSVKFNGVAAGFSVLTGSSIQATVPASTTGKITITTPSGTATSTANFSVSPPPPFPPKVTGFTPGSGNVGANVTITGSDFIGITAVKFKGVAATFSVISTGQIQTKVPVGALTGTITVTNGAGTATSFNSFVVTAPPAPTITGFTPTSGKAGATVTVNGANFTGATAVKFKGIAATFTVLSATQIRATVPTGATTGTIAVTTPSGTATSTGSYTVLQLPIITTFAPISGPVNTQVTISGKNFTGATIVRFNNKSTVAITVVSDTQITATVPVGTVTGPIAVTTAVGASADTGKFQVLAPPNITTFNPASGKIGATVTISGANFTGLRELKFFNNKQPTIVSITDTQITVKVPAGATTGPMFIRTGLGSMTTKGSFFVLPSAPPRSMALSGVSASAATQSITLTFNSTLEAENVIDAAHYRATVNGAAVEVESVVYHAAARAVTLGLPLRAGDDVTVAWEELRDSQGVAHSGSAGPLRVSP